MKSKSLMMLALLAAAPVASQAAMVEMDSAALSNVEGQGFSYGWNLNPTLGFGFNHSAAAYGYGYAVGVEPTVVYTAENDLDPTRNVSYSKSFAFGKSASFVRNK